MHALSAIGATGNVESLGPAERASGIEFRGVSHYFEKDGAPFQVLRDITMPIYEKEFVSIIGPSGCGKTTMLFIVAGLLQPTEGSVYHRSERVTGPSPTRGVVFQADAVFPWLTVYKNVEFGLKETTLPKDERDRIVTHYISLVGLDGWANLYPKHLSGGMRKRVDLARTYAINPDVLLLDESFGSLDAQTKETLQLELLKLWEQEKKTALFVTHDIEEAIFLADRVLIMGRNPGRIVDTIRVTFPRPRPAELKMTADFQELRHEIGGVMATL